MKQGSALPPVPLKLHHHPKQQSEFQKLNPKLHLGCFWEWPRIAKSTRLQEAEEHKMVPRPTSKISGLDWEKVGIREKSKYTPQSAPSSLRRDEDMGLARANQTGPGLRNKHLRWKTATLKTLGRKFTYSILRVVASFLDSQNTDNQTSTSRIWRKCPCESNYFKNHSLRIVSLNFCTKYSITVRFFTYSPPNLWTMQQFFLISDLWDILSKIIYSVHITIARCFWI